jgi:hypothetical protein
VCNLLQEIHERQPWLEETPSPVSGPPPALAGRARGRCWELAGAGWGPWSAGDRVPLASLGLSTRLHRAPRAAWGSMPASSAAESAVESGDGDDDEEYLRKPEREFTYRDPKVSLRPSVFCSHQPREPRDVWTTSVSPDCESGVWAMSVSHCPMTQAHSPHVALWAICDDALWVAQTKKDIPYVSTAFAKSWKLLHDPALPDCVAPSRCRKCA